MNLMLPDSGLLFWMTIIFAIVFFLLAKFGFPVITGMVEKRTRRIDEAIGAAREAEERLKGLSVEQERMIAEARAEQARILQETAAERDRMLVQAQEQAREEAGRIMEETKARIAEEKEAALRDVRREVARLSVAVAEKIIRKELSDDRSQMELIDRIIEETAGQE
jgi:F-type H+-transporting ATPase subunit b